MPTYDVVVIGAGPAGENAADYARRNGLNAVVVERELVGGECSYWACMPSKALLRPGEVLHAARRVKGAREAVTGDLDVDAVLELRDRFAAHWDDESQVSWLDSVGIDLVRGHGRLAGGRVVEVEQADGSTVRLEANRAVVVATGSAAAVPPIHGLRDIRTWDNRDITEAKQVPQRLVILGGGVVGVEMAQAWKRLGSREVTVVELEDRLLAREDPFVGEHLRGVLEDEGVRVLTGSGATRVRRDDQDGPVTLVLDDGTEVVGDELLVAAGRRPRTEDLGLETVGLEPGSTLRTDDQLRVRGVDGDWLYAVGDVNGRSLLTHQGKYQARLVGGHIAGHDVEAWADHRAVPRVVFTDPNVAAVGLTAEQAREQGIDLRTVEHDLGDVAGGALMGKGSGGPAQLRIDQGSRRLVGATFIGAGAGEMLHAATIAIVGGVTIEQLWHAVPAFPTVSEVWLRLLEADRAADPAGRPSGGVARP